MMIAAGIVKSAGSKTPPMMIAVGIAATIVGCDPSTELDVDHQRQETQCGPRLEFQPINRYFGSFVWAQAREESVVLVNFDCTGTYIRTTAQPYLILTAGHCVELGATAQVTFNFELDADGPEETLEGVTVEQSTEPDYALIALSNNPGVEPTSLSTQITENLTLIQHPIGQPKVIAEGHLSDHSPRLLFYTDLDTLVGSSGAGILNSDGLLIGVHTLGDCTPDGGTNGGWTIESIIQTSERLGPEDLEDC